MIASRRSGSLAAALHVLASPRSLVVGSNCDPQILALLEQGLAELAPAP